MAIGEGDMVKIVSHTHISQSLVDPRFAAAHQKKMHMNAIQCRSKALFSQVSVTAETSAKAARTFNIIPRDTQPPSPPAP